MASDGCCVQVAKKKRPSGGTVCCVPGCRNNSKRDRHVSWNTFPKDLRLKTEWVRLIQRQRKDTDWKPSPHHRICGAHFNATGKKTNEDKVPSIFPMKPPPVTTRKRKSQAKHGAPPQQPPSNTVSCGVNPCPGMPNVNVNVKTEPARNQLVQPPECDMLQPSDSLNEQSRNGLMWCPALILKTECHSADISQARNRNNSHYKMCSTEEVIHHQHSAATVPMMHHMQQQQQQQQQQQSYENDDSSPESGYGNGDSSPPQTSYPSSYVPTGYTVAYYPTYQPTTPPPGPFVPAPSGQRPYCAKEGQTYCENVEYYPTQLILRLLEYSTDDPSSFLLDEEKINLPKPKSPDYYNYTPSYLYDYGYTTAHTSQLLPGTSYGRRSKRQAEAEDLCPVNEKFVNAKAALNNDGDWKYVVNMPEVDQKFSQTVRVRECRTTVCSGICTPPTGATTRCEQQHVLKRLVSLDPSGARLNHETFLFPDCCICKIVI